MGGVHEVGRPHTALFRAIDVELGHAVERVDLDGLKGAVLLPDEKLPHDLVLFVLEEGVLRA